MHGVNMRIAIVGQQDFGKAELEAFLARGDEGAVILQKTTDLSADDTLGTVYFDRLFPMGGAAMLEAADLVVAGKHRETVQDENQASYEGWCREAEAKLN